MKQHNLRTTPRFVFFVVLVLTFLATASWTMADPLVAAPDEQAHIIHAYGIDHFQLGTVPTPPSKVLVDFTVPASINYSKIYPDCWHFFDKVPATCAAPWQTSRTPVVTPSYVGHYPPLYYALVGTGTWISVEPPGIYLMRLVSAGLGAFMLALSAYVIARWSRRWSMMVGVFVTMTPLTYFLSSSVNPSGFEIVTAICFWTTALVWALDYPEDPPHALVIILGAVGATLVLIRGLSPFWFFLIALVLAFLLTPRTVWRTLRGRRDLQWAAGAIAVAGVLAGLWIVTQGTLNVLPVGKAVPQSDSYWTIFKLLYHSIWFWLRQSVGVTGWLDTTMPMVVYHGWYLCMDLLLAGALVRGTWRQRGALVFALALTVGVPIAIVAHQAKILGIVWQGRDSMPLSVGVVLLAAGLCSRARERAVLARVLAIAGIGLLELLGLLSFYTNLRRYAVGRYGPHFFFLHSQGWSPPTGQFLTLFTFAAATGALTLLLMLWVWTTTGPLPQPAPARHRRRKALG